MSNANQAARVWCNMSFPAAAMERLKAGVAEAGCSLDLSENLTASNLVAAKADPKLAEADVAFGQPDPDAITSLPKLRWVHLTSAGYDRYDRADLRAAFGKRGAAVTNSSWVYEEPCAEHVLAMMLSLGRQLPQSVENQRDAKGWPAAALRADSNLLVGQNALILGFGTIARRLVELLTPFHMKLATVRRTVRGDEPIAAFAESELDRLLAEADHLINILPGGAATAGFLGRQRLGRMKPSAVLYNIGRGGTVDQEALAEALRQGRIAGAYLDVMTPEPLPPEHPLWTTPNCWITPHTAGGHHQEFMRLVEHFLGNLGRFLAGQELRDRVV